MAQIVEKLAGYAFAHLIVQLLKAARVDVNEMPSSTDDGINITADGPLGLESPKLIVQMQTG